jgi:hypothetical protein
MCVLSLLLTGEAICLIGDAHRRELIGQGFIDDIRRYVVRLFRYHPVAFFGGGRNVHMNISAVIRIFFLYKPDFFGN